MVLQFFNSSIAFSFLGIKEILPVLPNLLDSFCLESIGGRERCRSKKPWKTQQEGRPSPDFFDLICWIQFVSPLLDCFSVRSPSHFGLSPSLSFHANL